MATELAKAYVQIIPSAKGIKAMLEKEMGGEASAAGKSAGKSLGDGILSGLAGIGKAAAAAIGAATAAVGAFSTMSLGAYGNYEQLVGGVETLFKESSGLVMSYANNAYKTAGMSANQYMELATSFSSSLLQGLKEDTEAAARYTDIAISDMSDNINKFGSDAQSVQNAYQGFAKGNFTMLDNLKLGYGGTQSEMQRLLDKANELNAQQGILTDYQIKNYADIVAAIHVVQTEMDISGISAEEAAAAVASGAMTQEEAFNAMGTTAREATTTIQGSLSAAKSAFQNLVTGVADENANLDTLIGNFVDSVSTATDNIIPRFTQILSGMGQAIQKLAPVIAKGVPTLIKTVLPSLLGAGTQILGGIVQGITTVLPDLAGSAFEIVGSLVVSFAQAFPLLTQAAMDIIEQLTEGIAENLPQMIESGLQMLLEFSGSLRENASTLVDAAITLIQAIADGLIMALPVMIETIPLIVSNIANIINDNAPKLLETAAELIWKLVTGLIDNIPVILENMPQIIAAIWDTIQAINWLDLGSKLIDGIAKGISSMAQTLAGTVKSIMKNPLDFLINLRTQFQSLGRNLIQFFSSGISGMVQTVFGVIRNIGASITNSILNLVHSASGWGMDMIQGFANGIISAMSGLLSTVSNLASNIRSFLHFSRPDVGPLHDYETWMPDFMQGLAKGINANAWRVEDAVSGLADMMRVDMDAAFSPQMSVSRFETHPEARQSAQSAYGDINIYINGAQYSDENALAEVIAEKLQFLTDRRQAAFGTA